MKVHPIGSAGASNSLSALRASLQVVTPPEASPVLARVMGFGDLVFLRPDTGTEMSEIVFRMHGIDFRAFLTRTDDPGLVIRLRGR